MKNLQKMGGIAALIMAAAYVVGMVGFLVVVDVSSVVDPVQKVALMADNHAFLYTLHLIVYVVWGVFMVVLALALYERLKTGSPAMAQTATAFGLIWAGLVIASGMVHNIGMGNVVDLYGKDPAQAGSVWLVIESVFDGLGGGNEIPGSLWTLLVSWAALRARVFPRALNYLGVVSGVAGLLTVVPALFDAAVAVFSLGQIVWWTWMGIIMLRGRASAAA